MRLDHLTIRGRFKNLSGFHIDFDERHPMTVVVGRNGSGKSNLLEALTIIFRDLDLQELPAFSYELAYLCRGHRVEIDADPERKAAKGYLVKVDGKALPFSKFAGDAGRSYLPNYVFGYYSGPSNRMEGHFEKHQEKFYEALIKGKEKPLRPLFYARPVHSNFVLLAFFVEQDDAVQSFLRDNLRIEGLDYALFAMREPPWNSKDGDPRFWYARGAVKDLLARIYDQSLAPMRLEWKVPTGFRKHTTLEHLYLFLRSIEDVRQLAAAYTSHQEFFKALESTYISELISEVRISVITRKTDGSLTFREMSEGEQQLLMVLGLLRFTREEESLFLLDEPDTHLNPSWSVQYLDFLKKVGGAQENSHIIMATHDPLVVAGLDKEQVQILTRDEETSLITAGQPSENPRGMGIAGLLTSEVYGLQSQLDLDTFRKLDARRRLASKEELSADEREELKRLNGELEGLGFATTFRDPDYTAYVQARARLVRPELNVEETLSPAAVAERRELADQALANARKATAATAPSMGK